MQATAIDAPVMEIKIGGRERELRFDNEMIRRTEIAFAASTGVQMGYLGILAQADRGIFAALCAMCYGGIASAEAFAGLDPRRRTTFRALDAEIGYTGLIDQGDFLVKAAMEALDAGRGAQKKTDG